MRRVGFAVIVLAIQAPAGIALEPPGSPIRGGQPVTQPATFTPPNMGQAVIRSMPPAGLAVGGCDACGAEESCRGGLLRRLKDYICYRPLRACDCRPKTSDYVPPLHAWFPPCCHANGGNACGACGPRGGCAACGSAATAQLATPASAAPVALKKPIPVMPTATVASSRPAPPAAATLSRPKPAGSASPAPFTLPANFRTDYRIQPSDYLPPLPRP